jgi:hypothetical protein
VNSDPHSLSRLDLRLRRAARLGRAHGTALGTLAARAIPDSLRALLADECIFIIIGATVSLAVLSVLIALLIVGASIVIDSLHALLTQCGCVSFVLGLTVVLTLIDRHIRCRPRRSATKPPGIETGESSQKAVGGTP